MEKANKWDGSTRNWTLWSVWTSHFPIFRKAKSQNEDDENYDEDVIVACEKQEFLYLTEQLFQGTMEEAVEQVSEGNFIVLLVVQRNVNERDFSQRLELKVKEIRFEPTRSHSNKVRRRSIQKEPVNSVVAFGGLAEILLAIADRADVLVISGGYQLEPKTSKGLCCALNINERMETEIIRIQTTGNFEVDGMRLVEKIEPLYEDNRFKFTYHALKGQSKREVVQHRNFSINSFCSKVTDTLAYCPLRWDFPMPIVCGEDPRVTYNILCSPKFKMPRPSSSSSSLVSLDDSGGTDDSFCTASPPSFSEYGNIRRNKPVSKSMPLELESSDFKKGSEKESFLDPDQDSSSKGTRTCNASIRHSKLIRNPRFSHNQRDFNRSECDDDNRYSTPPPIRTLSWSVFLITVIFLIIFIFVVWQGLDVQEKYPNSSDVLEIPEMFKVKEFEEDTSKWYSLFSSPDNSMDCCCVPKNQNNVVKDDGTSTSTSLGLSYDKKDKNDEAQEALTNAVTIFPTDKVYGHVRGFVDWVWHFVEWLKSYNLEWILVKIGFLDEYMPHLYL